MVGKLTQNNRLGTRRLFPFWRLTHLPLDDENQNDNECDQSRCCKKQRGELRQRDPSFPLRDSEGAARSIVLL